MGLRLVIAKDANTVGKKAASEIINLLKEKKDAVLGLATGGTAEVVYPHIIKSYQKKEIDFKNVRTINLDEYRGLDGKNEQSYRYFMDNNLFNHVNINKKNTYLDSIGNNYQLRVETKIEKNITIEKFDELILPKSKKLIELIDDYLNLEKLYENKEYVLALDMINKIKENDYLEYIKEEVNLLLTNIDEKKLIINKDI